MSDERPTTSKAPGLPRSRSKRFAFVAIVLMLVGQAIVMTQTAVKLTVTHDEYWHIPVGLLCWKTGRFDVEPLNPPVLRMWATWPLLFTNAESPRTQPTSDLTKIGDEFLAANNNQIDRFVVIARLSMIALTLAAGSLLARWAWEWHGPAAACLVAWLWSRDPTVLGHGSLVTTDIGAAALWIAVLYATSHFAARPTRRLATLTGVLLGVAQAAKFTNVLLVPLVPLCWWLQRERQTAALSVESDQPPLKETRRALVRQWSVLVLAAWLSLNAAYLFRDFGTSLDAIHLISKAGQKCKSVVGPLAALPLPMPRDYVSGIDRQFAVMEARHPVFLDMNWSNSGYPSYYLRTLVLKVPHSTQLLVLAAFAVALFKWRGNLWRRRLSLLIPSALLLLVSSFSTMQLGIRYILPLMPLLFLFASELAASWSWTKHRWQPLAVLVALVIFDPWRTHPEYIAYFNEAAGGVEAGAQQLLDSNLDWGQDLHALKQYLDEHPEVQNLRLAYFGTLPPESLGIKYELPTRSYPTRGWNAVSVNFMIGRPYWVRDGHGHIEQVSMAEYSYFFIFKPHQQIGASIELHYVSDEDIQRWQSQMQNIEKHGLR